MLFRDEVNYTALHYACSRFTTPVDIVITLARLAGRAVLDQADSTGNTALDCAVQWNRTSAALYLTWLGANCKQKNKRFTEVATNQMLIGVLILVSLLKAFFFL